MPSLWCKKDIQRLNGRIATMSRFISRSLDRCHRFFKVLKGRNNFEWIVEFEAALKEMKSYLGSLPLLVKWKEKDILLLYLSVLESIVGFILVRNEKRDQNMIFSISKVLQDAKSKYTYLEKLLYPLIIFARRLKPYF